MFMINNNNKMPALTQQTAVHSGSRQPRGIQKCVKCADPVCFSNISLCKQKCADDPMCAADCDPSCCESLINLETNTVSHKHTASGLNRAELHNKHMTTSVIRLQINK